MEGSKMTYHVTMCHHLLKLAHNSILKNKEMAAKYPHQWIMVLLFQLILANDGTVWRDRSDLISPFKRPQKKKLNLKVSLFYLEKQRNGSQITPSAFLSIAPFSSDSLANGQILKKFENNPWIRISVLNYTVCSLHHLSEELT